jgi:hypothetical protein
MRTKHLLALAFSLSTLFVSAQSWLPEASAPSGEDIPHNQWFFHSGVYIITFDENYVGYVKSLRECESLVRDAGKLFDYPESDDSIVPSYLEDEDLSSSTWETAISVGGAEVSKSWLVGEWRIILILNSEAYMIGVLKA